MTEEKDRATLVVTHKFSLPPERVFDAFLDAKIARLFLFATPTGEMVVAEADPRVGGSFTFTDRRPGIGDVRHVGEYLELDRPRRIVFRLGVPQFFPGTTIVTIEIKSEATGCELTLTHEGILPDHLDGAMTGWKSILASVESAYENVQSAGWR
ncbi:MAG TPA: SRPBCC domain-containing protein [Oculatellaceae cyanobacterium]